MIDVHYWPTPNGWKVTIMLEEYGLPYRVAPVNILEGEKFESDFRKIAPNDRIPAIIDHAPASGRPNTMPSGFRPAHNFGGI
jgi:GST-like protein